MGEGGVCFIKQGPRHRARTAETWVSSTVRRRPAQVLILPRPGLQPLPLLPPSLCSGLTCGATLDAVPQPLEQGLHGAAAHPGVAANLQGHQPGQAFEGLEAEEGQAPEAEVEVPQLRQALEGERVHPAQPWVVAEVDAHEAVCSLEHAGRHVAEVVVAQVQVCQALGMEEEARGQLHQGVVAQAEHTELPVAREVAGRHGGDAVVRQAEVARVHGQLRGDREEPLAAAVHRLIMARTEHRAAGAAIRGNHPSRHKEGHQQQGGPRGPRPGPVGPGIAHLQLRAAVVLNGAHRDWGSGGGIKSQPLRRAAAPSGAGALGGGAWEHWGSWLKPLPGASGHRRAPWVSATGDPLWRLGRLATQPRSPRVGTDD